MTATLIMLGLFVLGWVQGAALREHLPGNHLVVNLTLSHGTSAFIEFERIRSVLVY